MMKNFFLTCAALLLAMGLAQAEQIDVNTPKADVGKMLPRVEQMSIESNSVYRAPHRAIGDEIAHWPLNTFEEFSVLMSMTMIDANDDGYGWSATSTGTNLNVTDIRIYDAAPTAITEVVTERNVDNTVYSIDGRVMGTSIDNLPQGIYIQGGKKILK